MTVKSDTLTKNLQIRVANGQDDSGKNKIATRTYKAKVDATNENLLKAAKAIGGLMKETVETYRVVETNEIGEQE